MTRHDERIAIFRHDLADSPGRAGRAADCGKLAVAARLAEGNSSARRDNSAAERREMFFVNCDIADLDRFARRESLKLVHKEYKVARNQRIPT